MSHETSHHALGGQFCEAAHRPVADLDIKSREDFRIDGDAVLLVASRSASSGEMAFPQREFCPVTGARDMAPVTFGPRGVLYSFSTIHVSSSRPTPYTLGYVDFDNGLRVMAHVRADDPAHLRCDVAVRTGADAEGWFVEPLAAEDAA